MADLKQWLEHEIGKELRDAVNGVADTQGNVALVGNGSSLTAGRVCELLEDITDNFYGALQHAQRAAALQDALDRLGVW